MIADTIGNLRADIEDDVHIFLRKTKSQRTRKINQIKRLMAEGNRKEEYAATVATVLLENEDYEWLKNFLQQQGLWDEELQKLHQELEFCALLNN